LEATFTFTSRKWLRAVGCSLHYSLVAVDGENTNSNVNGEHQTQNKGKLLFCPWIHSIKLQEILKIQESPLDVIIIWDVEF